MRLSYEEKLLEMKVASLEMNHFPVMNRQDRSNQKHVAQFSDGGDMGTFLSRQYQYLRNNKLKQNRKIEFVDFLHIEEEFVNPVLVSKLEEAKQICKKCGYYPIPDNTHYKGIEKPGVAKFADNTDVGSFIKKCRNMLESKKLQKGEEKLVREFLEAEYSYKAYQLKLKIHEIKESVKVLGCFPVPDHEDVNPLKVRKFEDGTDIGTFINHQNNRYKNHKMDSNEKKLWYDLLKYKDRLNKMAFIKRMKELFILLSEIKRPIVKHNHQFSDGVDMGTFISLYRKKIKSNDCSKLESWLFHKYLILEDKIDKDNFTEKAFETMQVVVEMERFPITCGPSKDQSLVRKFPDGKDIGSFVSRNLLKLKKQELLPYKEKLISQFLNINFDEIKKWNHGYYYLEEYFAKYNNMDIDSSYCTDEGFELGSFMKSNIELYYSDNKDLLTIIHENMLSKLDSNWMNTGPSEFQFNGDEKRQIKK